MLALRFTVVVFALMLFPCLALPKRPAPAPVEPIVYEGVRYTAPNDRGGYIEAWDVHATQKLWDLMVFTNRIDPSLEEDVQWVFVKTLGVRDGSLIVTSERGDTYRVNLETRVVTQSWRPNKALEATVAALLVLSIFLTFFWHRSKNKSVSGGCASA
jgi:hypothetical protein